MYPSATTWTFSWAPPYDEALKTIARLGFKGAELTIWSEEFLRDYYTPATNKRLRGLMADLGLQLASVSCIPVGIASEAPEQRAEAVEQFKRVLEAAEQLETDKVIALPPNPFDIDIPVLLGKATSQEWSVDFPIGLDWRRNWHEMVDVLRQFAGACDERAFLIALQDIGYDGPLSLELEDVPGAAGYPGFNRSPESRPEIERQHILAKDYMTQFCADLGIEL